MKDIFLLDLDETLLDFRRTEKENLTATLAAYGMEEEGAAERFHEINDRLWKALERGEITRAALVTKRFRMLFEELKRPCSEALVQKIANEYYMGFTQICYPFEGAAEFLRTLSAQGRVYLVTNGSALIQRAHIRMSGFAPYLSGAFISEEVGYDKPSPRFAEYVEAHIENYARARAVWVGDSLTSDKRCAEAAGIDFILFSPYGAPPDYAGFCAESFGEILALLRSNL